MAAQVVSVGFLAIYGNTKRHRTNRSTGLAEARRLIPRYPSRSATWVMPGCPVPGQHHDHRDAMRLDNHGVDRQIHIANQQQAAISNDNLPDAPALDPKNIEHGKNQKET